MEKPKSSSPLTFGPKSRPFSIDGYLTSAVVLFINRHPVVRRVGFWLSISTFFYIIFEIANATVVCGGWKIEFLVGLASFLGFWSFVAAVIATATQIRQTRRFSRWVIVLILFSFALTLADYYFSKSCLF
ncbi:MAG: hypothetical protein Q7K33_03535 [Candidatus Berkelbacteria bacterium]|nr:hypothetical protein [Candidatus Berkelbacteria bacterium]